MKDEFVKMPATVAALKALIRKLVEALKADDRQRAMTPNERNNYKLQLRKAKSKYAKLKPRPP